MIKLKDLITERRAQEARNWLDAVKLSRKGAGRKLGFKDKNGNDIIYEVLRTASLATDLN